MIPTLLTVATVALASGGCLGTSIALKGNASTAFMLLGFLLAGGLGVYIGSFA